MTAQSEQHTLNTEHKCVRAPETLRLAELAMPIILQEMEKDKIIQDYAAALRKLEGYVLVCQIPSPEPCCMNSNYCAQPQQPGGGRFARKAGCTVYTSVWVSTAWPPVCRPDWPNEPHCDALETYDMEATLVHELINLVVSNLGGIIQADYKHAIWAPGGTEARIQKAYKAMRDQLR